MKLTKFDNVWTKEEVEIVRDSLAKQMSYTDIQQNLSNRGFSRSVPAIRRKIIRILEEPITQTISESPKPLKTKKLPVGSSETKDQWDLIDQIISKHKDQQIINTKGLPTSVSRKILSLSDIHFPYADVPAIKQALHDHADADIVVLNGDLLEGYIFSTFEKTKRVAALDEYRSAFTFVKYLSEHFSKVVLVDGNHDVRVSRSLRSLDLPKEATQILRPNLLARIANGEELDAAGKLVHKHTFNNIVYQQGESWYVKVGKTLFVHPHGAGSSTPGAAVIKQMSRMLNRYPIDEVDSIVCGHTHQVFKAIINNILLMEQGTMASMLSYAFTASNDYKTFGQQGYAVVYQDEEGNTDFNKSNVIYCGTALPPKKSII